MSVDWNALRDEVAKYFPSAKVTSEFPGVIHVEFDEQPRLYIAGEANKTWNVDFYMPPYDRPEDTHLPSYHVDPWVVALNIAAAISRYELEL